MQSGDLVLREELVDIVLGQPAFLARHRLIVRDDLLVREVDGVAVSPVPVDQNVVVTVVVIESGAGATKTDLAWDCWLHGRRPLPGIGDPSRRCDILSG